MQPLLAKNPILFGSQPFLANPQNIVWNVATFDDQLLFRKQSLIAKGFVNKEVI